MKDETQQRKARYYGVDDDPLQDDPFDAVLYFLEDIVYAYGPDELPEQIILRVYELQPISLDLIEGSSIENLLEYLDDVCLVEEYSQPSAAMKAAERRFHQAVLAEYDRGPWEQVDSECIDVPRWVRENYPEWLEDDDD